MKLPIRALPQKGYEVKLPIRALSQKGYEVKLPIRALPSNGDEAKEFIGLKQDKQKTREACFRLYTSKISI